MFAFVSHLFGVRNNSPKAKAAPIRRRAQIGVEVLEGRALPSVTPIVGPHLLAQAPLKAIYVAPVVDVANVQGLSFHLISSSGKPAHDLYIQTESYSADGSASFTGTWSGDGPNSDSSAHQVLNGSIKFDANGNTIMTFSWGNGQGTLNNFSGTLSPVKNQYPAAAAYIYAPRYHLDGDVTTPPGTGGGPGHISGDGSLPPLMAATY